MSKKQPIASTLRNMKKGEEITFPIKKLNSVRVTAYNMKCIELKEFKTKTSIEDRLLIVKRIK